MVSPRNGADLPCGTTPAPCGTTPSPCGTTTPSPPPGFIFGSANCCPKKSNNGKNYHLVRSVLLSTNPSVLVILFYFSFIDDPNLRSQLRDIFGCLSGKKLESKIERLKHVFPFWMNYQEEDLENYRYLLRCFKLQLHQIQHLEWLFVQWFCVGCIYNEDFDPTKRPICFEEDGLYETMCFAGLLKQYYMHIHRLNVLATYISNWC